MKTLIAATLVALSLSTVASAQMPGPDAANIKKYKVAVVDIGAIFKNHPGFRSQMESMKGEVQGIEQQLEQDRQKIVGLEQSKTQYKPGTAEFSNIDDQVAKAKADFQLKMQKMRKGFLQKEAQVYHQTYKQVSATIKSYAEYYDIGMVLRYNGEVADPAQRESVLREINKPVQFQNGIDITKDILALIERSAGGAAAGTGQATRPATSRR
ncbi:MAG: OmpH family outer membrane protein [Planctomycetota bacterium]